jgi:hypothetical protein
MNEKHTPEQIIRKLRQAETELAAQRVGLPDPSAVRSGRGSGWQGGECGEDRGARIGTHTLIAPRTENGVRTESQADME